MTLDVIPETARQHSPSPDLQQRVRARIRNFRASVVAIVLGSIMSPTDTHASDTSSERLFATEDLTLVPHEYIRSIDASLRAHFIYTLDHNICNAHICNVRNHTINPAYIPDALQQSFDAASYVRGDCEDFAYIMQYHLRQLFIPSVVLYGHLQSTGDQHALLVATTPNNATYIFDTMQTELIAYPQTDIRQAMTNYVTDGDFCAMGEYRIAGQPDDVYWTTSSLKTDHSLLDYQALQAAGCPAP